MTFFFETFFFTSNINIFDLFESVFNYTVIFDKDLGFTNNLLNFPLPASERMNSLVILYLEISYITLFIFFIVSFVLLETILVHSSSEWNFLFMSKNKLDNDMSLSFHVYPFHFSPEEEHFIDIFVICIPTLIILQIIVPTLGYLYNEEMLYYDTYVSFDVNVIGNQWYWTSEYVIDFCETDHFHLWNSNFLFDEKEPILIKFDSLIKYENSLNRLLYVDHPIILPVNTNILFYFIYILYFILHFFFIFFEFFFNIVNECFLYTPNIVCFFYIPKYYFLSYTNIDIWYFFNILKLDVWSIFTIKDNFIFNVELAFNEVEISKVCVSIATRTLKSLNGGIWSIPINSVEKLLSFDAIHMDTTTKKISFYEFKTVFNKIYSYNELLALLVKYPYAKEIWIMNHNLKPIKYEDFLNFNINRLNKENDTIFSFLNNISNDIDSFNFWFDIYLRNKYENKNGRIFLIKEIMKVDLNNYEEIIKKPIQEWFRFLDNHFKLEEDKKEFHIFVERMKYDTHMTHNDKIIELRKFFFQKKDSYDYLNQNYHFTTPTLTSLKCTLNETPVEEVLSNTDGNFLFDFKKSSFSKEDFNTATFSKIKKICGDKHYENEYKNIKFFFFFFYKKIQTNFFSFYKNKFIFRRYSNLILFNKENINFFLKNKKIKDISLFLNCFYSYYEEKELNINNREFTLKKKEYDYNNFFDHSWKYKCWVQIITIRQGYMEWPFFFYPIIPFTFSIYHRLNKKIDLLLLKITIEKKKYSTTDLLELILQYPYINIFYFFPFHLSNKKDLRIWLLDFELNLNHILKQDFLFDALYINILENKKFYLNRMIFFFLDKKILKKLISLHSTFILDKDVRKIKEYQIINFLLKHDLIFKKTWENKFWSFLYKDLCNCVNNNEKILLINNTFFKKTVYNINYEEIKLNKYLFLYQEFVPFIFLLKFNFKFSFYTSPYKDVSLVKYKQRDNYNYITSIIEGTIEHLLYREEFNPSDILYNEFAGFYVDDPINYYWSKMYSDVVQFNYDEFGNDFLIDSWDDYDSFSGICFLEKKEEHLFKDKSSNHWKRKKNLELKKTLFYLKK